MHLNGRKYVNLHANMQTYILTEAP